MTAHAIAGFCTLCRSRCGTLNTVEDGRFTKVAPLPGHPTGRALCPKGRAAPELAQASGRLTQPLRRTAPKGAADPGWQPISWEEALSTIAERMNAHKAEGGAESVAFAVTTPSGTSISDSLEWVERFIRVFGSPNTVYATEICNWHKDFAHAFTFGSDMGTPDYRNAPLILLWGHNPASSWLAAAGEIGEGRRHGAKLAVVDPRRTQLAGQAEHWLRVRPGSDAALALGLVHLLLEDGGYDHAFLREWSNAPFLVRQDNGRFLRSTEIGLPGPERFVVLDAAGTPQPYDAALPAGGITFPLLEAEAAPAGIACATVLRRLRQETRAWTPEAVEQACWVPAAEVRALAQAILQAKRIALYGWSGIGQHSNATQTDRAIAILHALTGSYDTTGGNLMLRRQPIARQSAHDLLPPEQRAKALGLAERPLGPPAQGYVTARDLKRAIQQGAPYPVRMLMSFGANLLLAQADAGGMQEALQALDFHVHCDLFENPTAREADILLPVSSAWEREGLRPGFDVNAAGENLVQLRPALLPPRGAARSDAEIVFDLACRLGLGNQMWGGSLEAAHNALLAPLGLTMEQLRAAPDGMVQRPLAQDCQKYAAVENGQVRGFATETRRVEIYSEKLLRHGYAPLPRFAEPLPEAVREGFPFVLSCSKNGHFCHSQHRGLASLRRRTPEPVATLGSAIAAERGIADGDWIALRTAQGEAQFRARLDPDLHPQVAMAEHGWWQACPDIGLPGYNPLRQDGSNYNGLISEDAIDPISGSVPLRAAACDVRRIAPGLRWEGRRAFRLLRRRAETAEVMELDLAPADGSALPLFRPGQHVVVELTTEAGLQARAYSLCGPPQADFLRVGVRRLENGLVSSALARLPEGGALRVAAPSGHFAMPLASPFPVVMIAAGIGITPFLGYLEAYAAQGGTAEAHLFYSSRTPRQHAFGARLQALAAGLPRVALHERFTATTGRLAAADIPPALIAARARFYLCGPGPMLEEIITGLRARGVPGFEIFAEEFRPTAAPVSGGPHRVRFARSGREETWTPAAGPLLDFAEKLGLALPNGCRVGQCESCAVGLLEGQVANLSLPEGAEPEGCLTCQAIPVSDVVLDA